MAHTDRRERRRRYRHFVHRPAPSPMTFTTPPWPASVSGVGLAILLFVTVTEGAEAGAYVRPGQHLPPHAVEHSPDAVRFYRLDAAVARGRRVDAPTADRLTTREVVTAVITAGQHTAEAPLVADPWTESAPMGSGSNTVAFAGVAEGAGTAYDATLK
jgi:hypothetical protein